MACEVICCEINSIIDTLVDGHVVSSQEDKRQAHVQEQDDDNDHTTVEVTTQDPPRILSLLFSLLSETPIGELDDYRAGYLEKILSVLFRKRSKTMSAYMNQDATPLLQQFMSHLYSHSIMQIVQRLVMPPPSSFLHQNHENDDDEEDDNGTTFFSCGWSELPQAIDLLLDSLLVHNKEQDDVLLDKSKCASQVLITVIQNSSLTSRTMLAVTTDPILDKLCKTTYTLDEGEELSRHESSLTTAMNVLESIVLQLGGYGSVGTALDTSSQDQEEESQPAAAIVNPNEQDDSIEMSPVEPQVANANTLVHQLPRLLQGLSHLLQHESTKRWKSPMQFSKQEPLLGMSRLCIVRLLESLVLLGNTDVDAVLCQSDCLEICLDLFWQFQWCSMLHQSVANLLVHVFEGANERAQLQHYFLIQCNLLQRLMESFVEETTLVPLCLSETVLAMQSLNPPSISVQSECGSSVESVEADFGQEESVLPVSDDDVDAAMEQQQQQQQQQEEDVHVSGLNHEDQAKGNEDEEEQIMEPRRLKLNRERR